MFAGFIQGIIEHIHSVFNISAFANANGIKPSKGIKITVSRRMRYRDVCNKTGIAMSSLQQKVQNLNSSRPVLFWAMFIANSGSTNALRYKPLDLLQIILKTAIFSSSSLLACCRAQPIRSYSHFTKSQCPPSAASLRHFVAHSPPH